jgi:tetratricopeptide (TPR) repeat protein
MGRYDESIAQYQKAYDTDNLFIGSLSGIANNYSFKGDFAKAREYQQMYFDKATQVNDKLSAMFYKALSFMYENKLDDAIKAFEEGRAFAQREKQSGAMVYSIAYQGFALSEMGKASDGMKKYEEAISTIDKHLAMPWTTSWTKQKQAQISSRRMSRLAIILTKRLLWSRCLPLLTTRRVNMMSRSSSYRSRSQIHGSCFIMVKPF